MIRPDQYAKVLVFLLNLWRAILVALVAARVVLLLVGRESAGAIMLAVAGGLVLTAGAYQLYNHFFFPRGRG